MAFRPMGHSRCNPLVLAGYLLALGFAACASCSWGGTTAPTAWRDLGVVYTAPSGPAYYPSVVFDANGFGAGTPGYKMWYSNGAGTGAAFCVTSPDGYAWGMPTTCTGLSTPHHVQVLYDANGFGSPPSSNVYRMWYWSSVMNYTVTDLHYAESADGITWVNDQPLSQDPLRPIVPGGDGDWDRGSYGPVTVMYNPAGQATFDDANLLNNRFVMYYDGTTGAFEQVGLGYSADGLNWKRWADNPVLPCGRPITEAWGQATPWDSSYVTYGTVLHDGASWHFWYSGGAQAAEEGIGYASSADGVVWNKAASPIFQIGSSAPAYRTVRAYTPAVLRDGSGRLRMYYSVVGTDGIKKIAAALNGEPDVVYVDDNWSALAPLTQVFFPAAPGIPHTIGADAFAVITDGISAVASGGTVNVAPGTYPSTSILLIQKPLTLQSSDGPSATTIQGDPNNPYVIQITASSVTINGFTVTNPNYDGGSDPSGIVIDGGANSGIHLTNNVIHDVCTATRSPASFGTTGIVMGPVNGVEIDHNVIYNIWHGSSDPANGGAAGIVLWGNSAGDGPRNVSIHDNTIYSVTSPRDDAGIRLDPFTQNVTIRNNAIADSGEYGIWIEPDQVNAPVITENSIAGGTVLGLDNRSDILIDASSNWWGHLRGPQHATNANTGTGVGVSDGVTFSPWLGDGTDTQPSVPGFQPNLAPRYAIPTRLVFSTEPGGAAAGAALAPQPVVQAQDAAGYLGINYTGIMVLALASNPTEGVLSGTLAVAATDGTATFSGVFVDQAGAGYGLAAMATGVDWAVSAAFDVTNPAPSLTGISPSSALAGVDTLLITVTGANFVAASKVRWNGADRATLVNSSTELLAVVPAADLAQAGVGNITVFNPGPQGGASTAAAFAVLTNLSPEMDSGATATPNPAAVGQEVLFSVAGHDPEGQGLVAQWTFGDGSAGAGSSVKHAYTVPSNFQAIATLRDPQGNTTTSSVTVAIVAAATAPTPEPLEPLVIAKKRLRAKNPSVGKDTCQISGSFTLPPAVTALAGTMQTQIGSVANTFALDGKGRGKDGKSTFRLKVKMKKGVLQSRTVQYQIKSVGNFLSVLTAAGVQPGSSGNAVVSVQFAYAGTVYAAAMPLTVKGTAKSAAGK